jgi:hypothetical protein
MLPIHFSASTPRLSQIIVLLYFPASSCPFCTCPPTRSPHRHRHGFPSDRYVLSLHLIFIPKPYLWGGLYVEGSTPQLLVYSPYIDAHLIPNPLRHFRHRSTGIAGSLPDLPAFIPFSSSPILLHDSACPSRRCSVLSYCYCLTNNQGNRETNEYPKLDRHTLWLPRQRGHCRRYHHNVIAPST